MPLSPSKNDFSSTRDYNLYSSTSSISKSATNSPSFVENFDSARDQETGNNDRDKGYDGKEIVKDNNQEQDDSHTPIHNKYTSMTELEEILNGEIPLPVAMRSNGSPRQLIPRIGNRDNISDDSHISIRKRFFPPLNTTEPLRIVKGSRPNLGITTTNYTQRDITTNATKTEVGTGTTTTDDYTGTVTDTVTETVTATATAPVTATGTVTGTYTMTAPETGTATDSETITQEQPAYNNHRISLSNSDEVPTGSENIDDSNHDSPEGKTNEKATAESLNITKLEEKKSQRVQIVILSSILFLLCVLSVYFVIGLCTPIKPPNLSNDRSLYTERINYEKITNDDKEVKALSNNPDLHKTFYGLNYSPREALYPDCGLTQRNVTLDMILLSQLTKRIKVYSTDCNQVSFIFNAIQDLNLDMTVSVGVWIDKSFSVSFRQLRQLRELLEIYPLSLFNSIIVGNDVLFREDMNTETLVTYINYVRTYLRNKGIKDLPVGTSEIGSKWSHDLAKHVDLLAANIHPFFGGVEVRNSTKWTYDFLLRQVAGRISPASVIYIISEVGWPSGGGALQEAIAGEQQLQIFLDNWLCTNQDTDVGWYWYEAFDQPWKSKWNTVDSKWESQWGLFTTDRKMKNITIPQCTESTR